MRALAEIQILPASADVWSKRNELMRARRLFLMAGLRAEPHRGGMRLDGELALILDVVLAVNEVLYAEGAARLSTNIKLSIGNTDSIAPVSDRCRNL